MRKPIHAVSILATTALLAGCTLRSSAFPTYPTMDAALGEVLKRSVSIRYAEPFDTNRWLVVFQADNHGPSPTLLEKVGWRGWRMTDAVGLGGDLWRLGALSYHRANLGYVEKKAGTVTQVTAETHVVFGEVFDPAITWVELTLDREGATPVQANLANGIWVVHLPPENQLTGFEVTAGDANGRRFTASVARGRFHGHATLGDAPLVEYRNDQMGVRLEHPITAHIQRAEEDRITFARHPWTLTVERQPAPDEPLADALTAAGGRVLEQGMRSLGNLEAAYLLEARPNEDVPGDVYHARYLARAGGAAYEITCSVERMYEHSLWEREWRSVCARVLETVRLGSDAETD